MGAQLSLPWPLWPWLSLRPMLGDTDMAALTDTATDTGTDTDMARGPLTPAPMPGVTDMAAPTATVTDTDTDTDMARGPLMPSLLLLLRLSLRPMPTTDTALVSMATTLTATDSPPMLATDTDTIMARGQLTPMPGDTDTAAHTDTATDTDTDTDMARGPLMPMPGDTDTAAPTDTDTATGTDTLMASKLPPNLVACHRTPMSSKYLSHSC